MGKLLFHYFVAFFFVSSGLTGIVKCQNCPAPPCRSMQCGVGGPNCPAPCQCTLSPGSGGIGTCTSCAGELCKCSTASGPSRQLCCTKLTCVQPNRMPAIGDGTCRNLAKGI